MTTSGPLSFPTHNAHQSPQDASNMQTTYATPDSKHPSQPKLLAPKLLTQAILATAACTADRNSTEQSTVQ